MRIASSVRLRYRLRMHKTIEPAVLLNFCRFGCEVTHRDWLIRIHEARNPCNDVATGQFIQHTAADVVRGYYRFDKGD
jgi:hypothetical protein